MHSRCVAIFQNWQVGRAAVYFGVAVGRRLPTAVRPDLLNVGYSTLVRLARGLEAFWRGNFRDWIESKRWAVALTPAEVGLGGVVILGFTTARRAFSSLRCPYNRHCGLRRNPAS